MDIIVYMIHETQVFSTSITLLVTT
jgi:hypothetical protein